MGIRKHPRQLSLLERQPSERGQNLRGGWGDSCASWLRFSKKVPSESLTA